MKLIYATLTCTLSLILFSCDSGNNSTSTLNQEPVPTETKINTSNTSTPTTKLYNASVFKKGLDFSYEAEGKVSVVGKTITVTYENKEDCDNGNIFRQQHEELFNLDTNTLTSRANQVSNCFRSELPENWIDAGSSSDRFSVTTEGSDTVIKVNALEEDGTVILENTLVVRYSSNEETKSTVQATNSTAVTSSEAVLTASDPDSQIALRANPSESSKSLGYGLVGDRVQVIEQTTTDDYTWYKV
ncbi:SH3 domain-containing protein [Microcoleus sp. FACHB-53]|nr:SH3 domain-containing protein [Microcoleus sp. FACHB-53]